jgi:hypothetical protein
VEDPVEAGPSPAPPVGIGRLGHARRTVGRSADAEEVCRIALVWFGILLDAGTAAPALNAR